MPIQVRALRPGYYHKLRAEGDVFAVMSKKDLGSWMEEIQEPRGKPARGAAAEPADSDSIA